MVKLPYKCPNCGADIAHYGGCECRKPGAVEILCKEIGFRFDKRMETPAMLVAFVRVLVSQVQLQSQFQAEMTHVTGKSPSVESGNVMARVLTMLEAPTPRDMLVSAAAAHDFIHEVLPEDTYPTDHLIDQLSGCVSAIRFGLEMPKGLSSRHAAEAAGHIWEQVYGLRLFDSFTQAWKHDWVRAQFEQALLLQIPLQPST